MQVLWCAAAGDGGDGGGGQRGEESDAEHFESLVRSLARDYLITTARLHKWSVRGSDVKRCLGRLNRRFAVFPAILRYTEANAIAAPRAAEREVHLRSRRGLEREGGREREKRREGR